MSGARVAIDRLILRVGMRDTGEGEVLAQLVAEGLAADGISTLALGRRGAIRVGVAAGTDMKVESLAQRIVTGALRELGRAL